MTAAALRRLTSMQPGELRFRAQCELRKAAGRLRSAVAPPRWERRDLTRALASTIESPPWQEARRALRAGDHMRAHVLLGQHFSTRRSAFPLNARELPTVTDAITGDFPAAPRSAAARADRILEGRYDLLGYTALPVGVSPDWHADVVHGRHAPRAFWSTVRYLDPAAGDHKVIWELNRHQHWLTLGRAFAFGGDPRYYRAFVAQLASWLEANPPLLGTNWASMLELAFRSLSWMWSLELFAAAAGEHDGEPWIVDLLLGLDRQLTHIEHNLSYYFSPNTHLSGEGLALYVAGMALPELRASSRRAAVGRDVLVQEAARQVRSDGGHAELSTHYHRYSTDFYLLASAVARRAEDPATLAVEDAARRQARYLRTITDEAGTRPSIGDEDGGQLFPITGSSPADCRDTLASAAALLGEPALAVGGMTEAAYWLCGPRARATTSDVTAQWTSVAHAASGYFVSRTARGDHLVFDAGPHGFLNGGHAHADALSLTLTVAGRPLLIDPGTATYTMDPGLRDRFRSTMMHNALVLDGRTQSAPRGPFHWSTAASAQAPVWRSTTDCDYVEGTHDAYAPRRHTRAVLAVHGIGWWIVDHVLGTGRAGAECFWHIHPAWHVSGDGDHLAWLQDGEAPLALAATTRLAAMAPGSDPLAVHSPGYGALEPAPVLRGTAALTLPAAVAAFIPATAEVARELQLEACDITVPPGPAWHGAAFRVRWRGGAMTLLSAVERGDVSDRDTAAPGLRWGTAELLTDGRCAAVIDRSARATEAVLVNGALLAAQPAHLLVSLARPVPVLRLAPRVAPSVHEVAAGTPDA